MITSHLPRVEYAKKHATRSSAGVAQDSGVPDVAVLGSGERPGGSTPISDGRRLGESNEGAGYAQAVEPPASSAVPTRERVVLTVVALALVAFPVLVLWSQI